ncbi:unnamed protein product (macronuclear) [Paramecium tetraurelia]|uniref:Uncharacterized protein n=1 Tax=Paramecium tetraurelia TaxID=5888 RepID=A0C086_PARTE|nr:uncharacterized protein GSPATT00006056001 [Paramecium tetraurelia]CAK64203.1 unnamed protein product [Paramecium tetraurelia]|eukprot:XP_001431601.1 hypothetical protein (macronuclear) [Paramecium tetraurelia strain d4-2]
MYHYYVIAGGMILGFIALAVLNKTETQQKKVKVEGEDDEEHTKLKQQNQQEQSNKFDSQTTNDDMEALRQRKIEADERKNKIFKNLSIEDRQLVEDYFKKQAKQYLTGEVTTSDRRAAKLINIVKYSLYILFALGLYMSLTIAFKTTSPLMIIENLKHLVRAFLQQLFVKG